jgi:hypothetical protein
MIRFKCLTVLGMLNGLAALASAQVPATHTTKAEDPSPAVTAPVIIPAGVPLHVKVTHTAHLHVGTPVSGTLTDPIYVKDRLVLPTGSVVQGKVAAYTPIAKIDHEKAVLNGDFTPLHAPVVDFTSIRVDQPDRNIPLDTIAVERTTQLVRFVKTPKKSLFQKLADGVKTRVHDGYETLVGPNKKDRAVQFVYAQLPYHPQRIWAGTQFVADLSAPVTISMPKQTPVEESGVASLNGLTVEARLLNSIDSKTAKKGDAVTALSTEPVFDKDHRVILPEGTELDGLVSSSKPARSFGRNGQLRFAIRGVKEKKRAPRRADERVYGTLTAADGDAGQNISVDSEGNVKANPDGNRFVAPLLLAMTAAAGEHQDSDGGGGPGVGTTTVASNGFGIVARVIALTVTSANIATGFGAYAFAQSIYFRFLTRGHEVTFAKDTQVEVALTTR